MKFHEFIDESAIRADLQSHDKEGVVSEMVDFLVQSGVLEEGEKGGIVGAIMKRERLGSTGIGRGVAVPHAKHAGVDRLVGAVAVSSRGVDFESLDGEKAHLFFLLISPPDRPSDHLRALESISRQLHDDSFCRFLKQATSVDEIRHLLEEADNNQFV